MLLKAVILCFLPWLWQQKASCQASLICGIIEKKAPDNPVFSDRFGNLYSAEELSLIGLNIQQNNCGPIEDFDLIFEGAIPFSQQEIQTICEVFTDLSAIINAPSGEKAIVRISKTSLGAGVGATGTAYFSPQCGLGYNVVQQQLFTGGINADQHALIEINSNLNNYYNGPEAGIGPNEFDFYTAILHEALHVLGFGSQIGMSGASLQGFYTLWDLNLKNPAGDFLIESMTPGNGSCCATYNFNHDDFPNMPDIIWNQNCGASNLQFDVAQLPPVNGEYPGQPMDDQWFSQVLSHLDRTCGTEHYVMNNGIPPGAAGVQRTLTNAEMSILCKLGYDTNACDPECIAIAADDGNFFVGLNENIPIDFATMLSNDFPTDGTLTFKPDCGNHAGLTIQVVGNSFSVTGNALGAYHFCYTLTSCDGERCDVGVVRVVVTNPAIVEACQNLEPCQINPFWDFELFGSPDEMYPLLTLGDGNGMGDGVINTGFTFYQTPPPFPFYDNTPDLFVDPFQILWTCGSPFISLSTPFGNQSLGMIVRNIDGENWPEGSAFPLCEPIYPGMSGTISFFAMTPQACTGPNSPQVQARLEFSELPPVDQQIVYNNPGMVGGPWLVDITSTQNTNPIFAEYTITFTNNSEFCWNFLYLSGVSVNETDFDYGYLVVDNVSVTLENDISELLDINASVGPATPCLGEIVTMEVELCNNVICQNNPYTHPEFEMEIQLPVGLTHIPNADFPTLEHLFVTGEIAYGTCTTLELTAQVGGDLNLVGQNLGIGLQLHFLPDQCYNDLTLPAGSVSPMLCPLINFTCPCGPGGINIDASPNSPFYNAALGGVPYSALETAFNYDADNDGTIAQNEHNDCIAILGRLIVDQNVAISQCDNIQMQPCSEIVVGTNINPSTLGLFRNNIYACTTMWHGITVSQFSTLNLNRNTIQDAQFAVTALGGAGNQLTTANVTTNTFQNNHVGVIFPSGSASPVAHIPFALNGFSTTKPLLPPCDAGLTDYDNTSGYAGVVTKGTPLTVGTPGSAGIQNIFSNIRNGIVSTNAVTTVHRARFLNILGPVTPGAPSMSNARGNGVIASGGVLTVLNSHFNTVSKGVVGLRNKNLRVSQNNMDIMRIGVFLQDVPRSEISDNPSIGFQMVGIRHLGVMPAIGLNAHTIANNTNMFVSTFPGFGPGYSVAIDIDNALTIDAGNASITNNHFFGNGTLSDGIRINGAGGWDLADNVINFAAPMFGSNFGFGVRLTNTNQNYMYQNHLFEFDQTAPGSMGFFLSQGTGNRYCCNTTFGHDHGSRFEGACASTEWRVTTMNNHNLAISCAAGTEISQQFNYGNDFNMGTGTAFHDGNDNQVTNSRFLVQNMQQPHWPQAIATPNAIVPFFEDDGIDVLCESPCEAPEFAPAPPDRDIDESDLVTATGGFAYGPFGAALQWENERRLYERMRDYDGLLGAYTATDSFYAAAEMGKIGQYYTAESSAKNTCLLPSGIQNDLNQALSTIESNRIGVDSILAALVLANTLQDSLVIYAAANIFHAGISTASGNLEEQSMLAQQHRNTSAVNALSLTNGLAADHILEQNRKKVQQLYLQTLGLGITQLTAQQFADAEAIALQCPREGGSAVYAARALYRLNVDRVFAEDSLCLFTQERNVAFKTQIPPHGLRLTPNPAGDQFSIEGLGWETDQQAEVMLIDLNGRVCLQKAVSSKEATISTFELPQGVYICRIQIANVPPAALKLIIVH